VGIFIADKKPGRPVVALTLVPKSIPAQSIVVQLDPSTRVADDAEEEAEGYSNRLVQLLREIVRGRVPQGYSAAPIAVGQATVGPVRATPEERWSGADMDIHRYRIENTGAEPVELTDPSFYEPGVKAVLFFPRIRIAPGETTAAYTVRGLDQEGAGPPGRK
jgi:conjugal transfer pilus assembly protein TraK